MREWQLKSGDPLSLTLATDVRLSATDYSDDRCWELTLGGGDPAALALQTTYGLRARSMRLYPQFTLGDAVVSDPAQFSRPPILRQAVPNFLRVSFAPFPDMDVTAEYWVPQPHAIAGRFEFVNNGPVNRVIQLDWIGQLNPNDGQRLEEIFDTARTARRAWQESQK